MASADAVIHARVLAAMAADQGILDSFGMSVRHADAGRCDMAATVPATLVNAAGFAHGTVAFAVLDTACAYALSSLEVRGVTVNANTTYVKGAEVGALLHGSVRVVSRTRRVATLMGEVFIETAGQAVLAAHGSFVFQLIDVKT